jgi:hypothetical protein
MRILFNRVIPLPRNQAKLNKRILGTAAEFVTVTSLSCRQAVSPTMHEFILGLIQIGAGLQANDDAALIDVAGLLDTITEKRMTEAIRERGDAKFAEAIGQLSEVRFANFVVDAGTVHSLKTIVCLLTNPHYPIQPVLFALREDPNFTADDYAVLFVELFSSIEQYPIVMCSVVIDNLRAQSSGLDRVVGQSIILHIKCFAHMINLVLVNTMTNAYFAEIMDEMKQTQRLFRLQPAIDAIGRKCPKFVRTRWFFMMDTLAYFMANFEQYTAFLIECGEALGDRDRLPLEIFELSIIMHPFSCFLSAVESRTRALPDIVPLSPHY